jgi:hypothetical protein
MASARTSDIICETCPGRFDDAIGHLTCAIRLYPMVKSIYDLLLICYFRTFRWREMFGVPQLYREYAPTYYDEAIDAEGQVFVFGHPGPGAPGKPPATRRLFSTLLPLGASCLARTRIPWTSINALRRPTRTIDGNATTRRLRVSPKCWTPRRTILVFEARRQTVFFNLAGLTSQF